MAYQGISLGDIVQQAGAIKGQQQRSTLADLQIQQAQTDQANTQGIQSTMASNPNASLADLSKFGPQGVQASQQLSAAQTADLTNQYRKTYQAATAVVNSDDPVATVHQVAPEFAQQYDRVHGQGAFDKLAADPNQVKAQAQIVLDHAMAGLVDPDKQFQAHQEMIQAHYKQQGPGGEADRNAATIAAENARNTASIGAENARNRFTQGQENSRNAANIESANTRAGFTKDGQLDPKFDSQVQAILDYRAAPYSGVSMRSGPGASIMAEVNRRDPTYDATQYPAKAAALKSLMAGKDGTTLDQVNTAVAHLAQLKPLLSALNTGDISIITAAKQAYQQATGNPAPTNASIVANMAAGEVNKVVTGGPGAEGDRDLARNMMQLKGSPAAQQEGMDNIIGLMAGRLNAVGNRFKQAKLGQQFDNMLMPETKAALAAHAGGSTSPTDAASASVPTATGPNGQKLYLRNGQWSPK
jgi:hypothetical protein